MTPSSPPTGLCLIAEVREGHDGLARTEEALAATGATTLIVTAPAETVIDAEAAGTLVRMAQAGNVAALIRDDWRTARTLKADGVHLGPRADIDEAYRAARAGLAPGTIVGVDAGTSRHDAMMLGEAGADYVAFARAGDDAEAETALAEILAWWSEVFVIPVVAFGVATAEEAARLVKAKPDFLAVPIPEEGEIAPWAEALKAALTRSPSPAPGAAT